MKKTSIEFNSFSFDQTARAIVIYDIALKKYKNEILKKCKNAVPISIRAHETSKNIANVIRIYKVLSRNHVDKKSVVVALGGGVVGDIAGFIASTYLRGLPLISVPTTILSQVDSSLGGKNGVNLETGKNLVGTFYQPDRVIIDFKYLETLSDREIVSGLGEVLKYSILDKKIEFPEFDSHKTNRKAFLRAIKKLTPSCVAYKMKLVQKDERDEKGIRQLLNLGHTFGHALEALTSYKKFKHGEAVIWGIKFACLVSYTKNMMHFEDFRDVMNLANRLPIPPLPRNLNPEMCYKLALRDKKSENQKVKMVLLKKRGDVKTQQVVSKQEFINAVKLIKDFS